MKAFHVFSLASGVVTPGATIESVTLRAAAVTIEAVTVGEEGRGRRRGVLPVGNAPRVPCPHADQEIYSSSTECSKCHTLLGESQREWHKYHPNSGKIIGQLLFAEVGQTKSKNPKLFAADNATDIDAAICVLRTKIGFRGGNAHTGDRLGWACKHSGCDAGEDGFATLPSQCPTCGTASGGWSSGPEYRFAEFPGQDLCSGTIAQGDAGRMGWGTQHVVLMPRNVVFRTAYSGRLYGSPSSHYYMWDGEKMLVATWDERMLSDCF